MTEYYITKRDEAAHAPGNDTNLNESAYTNGFDPLSWMGGWMCLGNRVPTCADPAVVFIVELDQ